MGEPFSVSVSGADWRSEAEEWINDRVVENGHRVTGPLDHRLVAPWSTHVVVPTDVGILWFKALCPSMAFEPALQDLLARLVPDDVDRPYAIDAQRGWMLTHDRGVTLGDSHEPTLDDWCAIVAATALSQRTLAHHGDEILAVGVPDCSPETVPGRMDELVDRMASLPEQHPSHVDSELRSRLLETRSRVSDAAEQLATAFMPATVQHGDLHPWNVFVADGSLRVFDFGDLQWAAAVEVLSVPHGLVTEAGRLSWRPVRDAYVEQWEDIIDARSVHVMWEAAAFTRPVNRAQTWLDSIEGVTEAELAEFGIAPLHHLRRVLDA